MNIADGMNIGAMKIRELHKKAEEALGKDFDIRNFNEVFLALGTVTLPILERRVAAYISHKNEKSNGQ